MCLLLSNLVQYSIKQTKSGAKMQTRNLRILRTVQARVLGFGKLSGFCQAPGVEKPRFQSLMLMN